MVVFAIRNEDLIRVGGGNVIVPRELESFLLPSQWAAICDAMESSRMQGTFLSCATEFVICLIFVFPCIFCCHPCFYQVFTQCEMDKKTHSLNVQLFQGQPVLSYKSGILSVNTDFIYTQTIFTTVQTGSNVVANIIHSPNNSSPPPMATVSTPIPSSQNDKVVYANVVASPVVVETRSMYVIIPANAGPGSVLTVVAPNGTTLSVVCPQNAAPGSQILVNY